MDSALATRIESTADQAAAASLGLACAFAASVLLGASFGHPLAVAEASGIGAVVYFVTGRLLSRIAQTRTLPVRAFEVRTIDPEMEWAAAPEQLLLTHVQPPAEELEEEPLLLTDVHAPPEEPAEEPLVLDDVLAQLGPDSRVVRLFDRTAMPTPAQLKSRIDAHLGRGAVDAPAPDASQALHDALAELRRSIG